MPDVSFVGLLIVALVAFLAPLLLGLSPARRLPSVVIEIVAGIVIGPSVLGWVRVDLPISILSVIGLAFLLFLAGLEVELERLRGRLLIVRGVPALLYRPLVGARRSLIAGLLQATSLSFIVAASQIGLALGLITKATGAALIAAGLLSVLIFPILALTLLRRGDCSLHGDDTDMLAVEGKDHGAR